MKLFSKIAALSVGLAMAVGVGVLGGPKKIEQVNAAAGDVITFEITIDAVTKAGATWPTTYSNTQTTWSMTSGGVTIGFAAANFTTGTGADAGTMQNRVNAKGCSYLVSTSLTNGYAIKSVQGTSSTARNWDFYGATSTISVSNDNPAKITGGTKVGNTNTNNAEHAFGSGTTYDSTNYPHTHFAMVRTGSNAGYYTKFTVKVVQLGASASTMVVKNSSGQSSSLQMMYGNLGGMLLYAYEEDGTSQITSGVTWTVSDSNILVLDTDFSDNHCWVKPGSKIGSANLTAVKSGYTTVVTQISVVPGDLSSIEVSGSMTNTSYKVGDSWNPAGLVVTATYESSYEADVTSEVEWSYNPASATSTSVKSVVATASFGGETADSDAQSVTVSEGVTYDLTNITGFSSWTNSYSAHTVTSSDVGSSVAATMAFSITNKQSSGVGSTYPCIGSKTNSEMECLTFTLTETGKKITSIDIVFVTRYIATYPSLHLHKGAGISSAEIASLTMSGNQASEHSLSYNGNLNDTVFTVGYNAHQTSSNGAVGIKSISIGLAAQGTYGTTHHIKVTQFPNLVYHVGEVFDSTGLQVTAYDGAEESTANFKDVTADCDMGHTSGIYTFDDVDVPTSNMWLCYEENDQHFYADDIVFNVYAVAEYELVTEEPSDWSGNYLIVGTNADSDLVAMNGGLTNPDVESGYKVVSDTDGVIEAGQELEWTVESVSGGYSIKSKSNKYIGSLAAKSNGMLVSDSALVNTFAITDSDVSIIGTNEYHLAFNTTGDRFRYYSSGAVKLYKLKVSDNADAYAQTFLGAFTCDASGENAPTFVIKESETYWSWSLLKHEYNSLTAAEKEQFHQGVASQAGTNIQKALARYDYVVGKYGTDTFEDFMDRNPEPIASGSYVLNYQSNLDASSSITIIVIVAVASMTLLGVTLVLRKRKHQ